MIIQDQMRDAFPYVYAEGRVRYCTGDRKWVSVAYRTKRSIIRHLPDTMRRAEKQAQWNGRLSLPAKGSIHLK